jgi:Tol biopolymer transport system component
MNETRDLLERVGDRFAFPADAFERLEHRRDRKRRDRRMAAGVAGIAIFAALVFGLARATLSGSGPLPAVPDQSPSPSIKTEGLPQIIGNSEAVVMGRNSALEAVDRTTGDRRTLVTCKDPCIYIYRYAVSTDRQWLAYEVSTCLGALPCEPEAGIWVANALGEQTQLTQSCQPEACDQVIWAWSPAGATLAVGESGNAPGLFTIDPQSGERTQIANDDNVTALAWSLDGTRVAYAASAPPIGTSHKEVAAAYAESAIHVVELATGRSTTLSDALGYVETMAWSPDGTRLVVDSFVGDRDRITVLETDGSDQRVLVDQGAPQGPGAPAWSPDGTRIAYVSTPGSVGPNGGRFSFEVWVIGADGSTPTRLFHGKCCIGDWDGPVWSPDGGRIAFFDDIDVDYGTWLVVNADGTGGPTEIDELEVKSWRSDP